MSKKDAKYAREALIDAQEGIRFAKDILKDAGDSDGESFAQRANDAVTAAIKYIEDKLEMDEDTIKINYSELSIVGDTNG